jgi:hypothetical protein
VIVLRRGSIVNRASIAEVPTEYLGPERDDEPLFEAAATPRESISTSRRFRIMQRLRELNSLAP